MSSIKFIGYHDKEDVAALVFAGAQDTPGITSNNPVFSITVDWGTGGQSTSYTSSSSNGIKIQNHRVCIVQTDDDSKSIKYYSVSGAKTITVTGGWKNSSSDSESFLSLPKQSTVRYGDNNFLNDKKGSLALSTSGQDLVFKFDGDYVGLRSSDKIKLVKWKKYTIPATTANFRLESDADVDATYSDQTVDGETVKQLQAKGKTGFLKYYYDISGITYTGEFEIVNSIDSSVAPTGANISKMITQRYRTDVSAYNTFEYNDDSSTHTLSPCNKTNAWTIRVGSSFKLHGVGDFAHYVKVSRIDNDGSSTQAFSGTTSHMFAGCIKLKFSNVITSLNFSNITKLIGFMSGCGVFTKFFDLNNVTSNTTDLTGCFEYSGLISNNIKHWNVSNATSLESMLEGTAYNHPGINSWDTSNTTNFKNMFKNNTSFNRYIGSLDTSSATNMKGMFANCSAYNGFVRNWDVSNVQNFEGMFQGASSFNKDVDKWETNSATNMGSMFQGASSFNKSVWAKPSTNRWNTSNVENMEDMFSESAFNKSINKWEIGKVRSFRNMFNSNSAFNQSLYLWSNKFGSNQSSPKTTDFEGMFQESSFNKPVRRWNVSHSTSIKNMFKDNTSFNQELFPGWKLKASKCKNVKGFFDGVTAFTNSVANALFSEDNTHFLKTFGGTIEYVKGFSELLGHNDSAYPDAIKHQKFKDARSSYESTYSKPKESIGAKSLMAGNLGGQSWSGSYSPGDITVDFDSDGHITQIYLLYAGFSGTSSDFSANYSNVSLFLHDSGDDSKVGDFPVNGQSLVSAYNSSGGWVRFDAQWCEELSSSTSYTLKITNNATVRGDFYWRANLRTDLSSSNSGGPSDWTEWVSRFVQIGSSDLRSKSEVADLSTLYVASNQATSISYVSGGYSSTHEDIDTGDES